MEAGCQVLVVGGTRGVGLAAARAFSASGDRVRLTGVELDLLAARADEGLAANRLDTAMSEDSNAHLHTGTHPQAKAEPVWQAVPEDDRLWVSQTERVFFSPADVRYHRRRLVQSAEGDPVGSAFAASPSWTSSRLCPQRQLVLPRARLGGRARRVSFRVTGRDGHFGVPDNVEEMVTLFNVSGCMCNVHEAGRSTEFEGVFDKIEMCRHFAATGLGADCVDRFIR